MKTLKIKKYRLLKTKKGIRYGLEKNINNMDTINSFLFNFEKIEKYKSESPNIDIVSFVIPLVQNDKPGKNKNITNMGKKFLLFLDMYSFFKIE